MVLLYAPFHKQNNIYHDLRYTSCRTLAGTRNISMDPPWRIDPMTHHIMSWCSAMELNLAPKLNSVASFGLHLRYQPFFNYIPMLIVTILYNEMKKWAAILDILKNVLFLVNWWDKNYLSLRMRLFYTWVHNLCHKFSNLHTCTYQSFS